MEPDGGDDQHPQLGEQALYAMARNEYRWVMAFNSFSEFNKAEGWRHLVRP
jgi:hypothetical protein